MPTVMILDAHLVAGRLTGGKMPSTEALNIIGPKKAR